MSPLSNTVYFYGFTYNFPRYSICMFLKSFHFCHLMKLCNTNDPAHTQKKKKKANSLKTDICTFSKTGSLSANFLIWTGASAGLSTCGETWPPYSSSTLGRVLMYTKMARRRKSPPRIGRATVKALSLFSINSFFLSRFSFADSFGFPLSWRIVSHWLICNEAQNELIVPAEVYLVSLMK